MSASKRLLIVGEAPGADEEVLGTPFVGASGAELARMLAEAGFRSGRTYWSDRIAKYAVDWTDSELALTNVCLARPPANDITQWISPRKTAPGKEWIKLRDKWVMPQVAQGFDALLREIQNIRPHLIIAAGNTPLWALTGQSGIAKWRGSQLRSDILPCDDHGFHIGATGCSNINPVAAHYLIPIFHPAAVLREWKTRQATVQDLRRAARFRDSRWTPPPYQFTLRPSHAQATQILDQLLVRCHHRDPLWLSFDIETRHGHIACAGLAWSRTQAICLPLICQERTEGYWNADQESDIVRRLAELLTHPNVRVIGQNILYDSQYTWRHWGFVPRVAQDTMISQHSIFSDLPKSLAFLASLYADHYVFWKDEGRNWEPGMPEDDLWHYNCLDCTYTFEVAEVLRSTVARMGLEEVHRFQQHMFWPVLRAMQLGVRIDLAARDEMILDVQDEIAKRESYLAEVLGHPLNPDSPKQMHALFYDDLRLPPQMTRAARGKPGHATLDDDALMKLALREPLIRPLVAAIGDIRTLRKFLSNFLTRQLDGDRRWRCSINIGGSASGKSAPKTYRLSTSESAFGTGANMQNIPSEKSKSIGKAAARAKLAAVGDPYSLPNIRSIFVPDPSMVWIELDLQRADLFVVVYEADDAELKRVMHLGADIHLANAFLLTGKPVPPLAELVESHPAYRSHREPMKLVREFAKVWCHGTDYGGQPKTMAAHTGRSIAECERAKNIWFGAHPGILRWHERVREQIFARRFIANKLGYRWYIFDRIDSVVPEAIAWVPQSTVSVVINRIWMNLFREAPWIQVLIQVHDALCMQCPRDRIREALPIIDRCAKITVPYPDPLVIPYSLWCSPHSWGCACDDCKSFNAQLTLEHAT